MSAVERAVEAALGTSVHGVEVLSGGCVGEVYGARLADGTPVVVKRGGAEACLDVEAYMLRYLAARTELPVPAVLHGAADLLVMERLPGTPGLSSDAQAHGAELLAALHGIETDAFGLERDTLIGGLHQPNPRSDAWVPFFAEHRVIHMADEARRAGRLGAALHGRVLGLADALDRWLAEPPHPSPIHGDAWGGNVLCEGGRVMGFVDPAVHCAHPEVELAFGTLFGTFREPFFRRYEEIRPLETGFFEERRDLYNLYPLLVHVRLFGGSYVGAVEQVVGRYGF